MLKEEENNSINLRLVESKPQPQMNVKKEEDAMAEALRRSQEDYQNRLDREEEDFAVTLP
jgi:hypothetical protein